MQRFCYTKLTFHNKRYKKFELSTTAIPTELLTHEDIHLPVSSIGRATRHTRTRIIFPELRVSTLSAPPNLPRDKNRPIIYILRRLDQRLLLEFGNPEVKSDKKYKRHGHVSDM
jgi:hypothetical protein